jgi:hypothetical protein
MADDRPSSSNALSGRFGPDTGHLPFALQARARRVPSVRFRPLAELVLVNLALFHDQFQIVPGIEHDPQVG